MMACSPADASSIAHLRRAAGDVRDTWPSILSVLESAAAVVNASRPGFFADLDILEIGNGGLTPTEERAVFALWCAVKSPLLLGNDLGKMGASTLETVGNSALLAVNQDALGIAATRVSTADNGVQVWAGALQQASTSGSGPRDGGGGVAGNHVVVVFNPTNATASVTVEWSTVNACAIGAQCVWDVHDLWRNNVSAAVANQFSVVVETHAAVALRLESGAVYYKLPPM